MAQNPKPPRNDDLDKRIAARQANLDAYVAKYDAILDKRAAQYGKEILPTWKNIGRDLTAAINELYAKYADDNGQLKPSKLREVERLKFLRQHTAKMVYGLEGQQNKLTSNLAYTYTESFYFHAFALQDTLPEVNVIAPALTHATVVGVLANPWLPDGMTYSDRIRANTVFLAGKMREAVETAVGRGWDVQTMARRIQAIAGEGYFNSVRLARTELNRAAGQASSHVFMQNADVLEGKRWNATLDSRTAPKDADNDGKIYELDYDTPENPGRPGERIPNHPNCRCKWTPLIEGLGVREGPRIARGDGDTPDNFGERTYTNARTYREYAKERGIDLDEKLRNDDPRRYLRRGEALPMTLAKTAATATAVVPPAAPPQPAAPDIQKAIPPALFAESHVADAFYAAMLQAPTEFIEFATKHFAAGMTKVQQGKGDFYTSTGQLVNLSDWTRDKLKTSGVSDKDRRRAVGTLIHEVGHGLDYGANVNAGGYKFQATSEKYEPFRLAVVNAQAEFSKLNTTAITDRTKRMKDAKKIAKAQQEQKAARAKLAEMQKRIGTDLAGYKTDVYEPRYAGLSDIFDGITKKRLNGGYGHEAAYWKNPDKPPKEVFANLFELHVHHEKEAIDTVRKYFPDIVKAFEEIIKTK
jgi:SPP1 gp7 family putative phage head morphogenesis protein